MKRSRNLFSTFLELLHVKHTTTFSEKLFEEHPNKNNLLGLSQMLSYYNIENTAIRIKDKDNFDFSTIESPIIAQVSNDFVVIYKITVDKIYYLWRGVKVDIVHHEFKKKWSGILLIAEANKASIEPDYRVNCKISFFNSIKRYILHFAIAVAFIYVFIVNRLYTDWGLILLMLVNIAGIYTSYLLVLKQLHIQSNYANKLCTLFKKSDCNDILESKAAKIGGIIGWSEIGLGYFISNLIITMMFPTLIPYLALINIVALPYTVWSVWYQKFRAKQWCPLCLIIQLLLWCVFAVVLIFGYVWIPSFAVNEIIISGLTYIIPVSAISLIIPLLSESRKGKRVAQELNALKTSEDIFIALLKNQPYHKIELSDSQIIFGNPDARTRISIFSNPHCNPCAKMHQRVNALLKDLGDNICVQSKYMTKN